jgi:hypothetical protein
MKKSLVFIMLGLMAFAVSAQQAPVQTSSEKFPVIQWNETTHNFGKVKQNEPVAFEFKATNTGTVPLQIFSVERSCGCTTPEWTSAPIQPGATGIIKVVYDSKVGGVFNKTVTVKANTKEGSVQLVLTGEVVAPSL